MPVPPDQRQPHARETIPPRQIKTGGDPESFDKETIAWQFFRIDRQHAYWGWSRLRPPEWRDILSHLISLEGLKWAEIKAQSGGRNRGTNHHPVEISELIKPARDRLRELRLDDFTTIFSLRITNTLRLY